MKLKSLAKNTALATGFFRPAEWIYRTLIHPELSVNFRKEVKFYSNFIGPGDLCFDIGAYIGTKTEVFLQTGASVVAFEPQEDCFRELMARCKVFQKFTPVKCAVGNEVGEATLYIKRRRSTSSLRQGWEGDAISTTNVPVTTIDEAIKKYGAPKYCKMDVEGYNLEVLQGLSQPIEIISFEYHRREIDKAILCLNYLESMGTLLINVTPAELPYFASVGWLKKDDFVSFFMHNLSDKYGYHYGDIFVIMS
jgi:FkbM family methyltransferase